MTGEHGESKYRQQSGAAQRRVAYLEAGEQSQPKACF
jgi:hypothetical protein